MSRSPVRQGVEPPSQRHLLAACAQVVGWPARSGRRHDRRRRRPARARSLRPRRRAARTRRSLAGGASGSAPAARPAAARAGRRRTGGGSGTSDGDRRAATTNRFARSSASRVSRAVVAARDGVAQGAGEAVEDRGLQQEVAGSVGLAREDLLGEVVDDVPVVAGELGDERARVGSPGERQRRELQGGDPALGPTLERGDIVRRSASGPSGRRGGRGLVLGEPQVRGADLDQLAPARSRASGSGGSARVARVTWTAAAGGRAGKPSRRGSPGGRSRGSRRARAGRGRGPPQGVEQRRQDGIDRTPGRI